MSKKKEKKELSEESMMIRTIITSVAIVVPLIAIAVLVWIGFPPLDTLFIDETLGFNTPLAIPVVSLIFGIVYANFLIIFATVREYYRMVAGWFEVVLLAIIVNVLVFLMYNSIIINGIVTIFAALFVVYLHRVQ